MQKYLQLVLVVKYFYRYIQKQIYTLSNFCCILHTLLFDFDNNYLYFTDIILLSNLIDKHVISQIVQQFQSFFTQTPINKDDVSKS